MRQNAQRCGHELYRADPAHAWHALRPIYCHPTHNIDSNMVLVYAASERPVSTHLAGVPVPEGDAQAGVVWGPLRFASPSRIGPIGPQLFIFAVPALRFGQLDVIFVHNRCRTRSECPCEARARASCHARQKTGVDQCTLRISVQRIEGSRKSRQGNGVCVVPFVRCDGAARHAHWKPLC